MATTSALSTNPATPWTITTSRARDVRTAVSDVAKDVPLMNERYRKSANEGSGVSAKVKTGAGARRAMLSSTRANPVLRSSQDEDTHCADQQDDAYS